MRIIFLLILLSLQQISVFCQENFVEKNDFELLKEFESTTLLAGCKVTEFLDEIATAPQAWVDNLVLLANQGKTKQAYLAWRYLDGPIKRLNVPSLNKVIDLIDDTDFMNKLGTNASSKLESFCKNAKNPIPPATNPKMVPLIDHLENLRVVANRHSTAAGWDQVVATFSNSNYNVHDGISHFINKASEFDAGQISQFEGNIAAALADAMDETGLNNLDLIELCSGCMFDIKLFDGTLVELKSYSPTTIESIKYSSKFINQFKTYFQGTSFQYWFNSLKGVDIPDVKAGFKKLFLKPNMYNTLSAAGTPPIFSQLNIIDEVSYLDAVNDFDSGLYDFINVL